ncbi:MAG: hypothetical protein JXA20_00490 [Spirochaetes bacterium]|nr:hypothetical protein [Spirochaetota bacterium]
MRRRGMQGLRLLACLLLAAAAAGCGSGGNRVLDFLENAELQYHGDTQRENLAQACRDILTLTPDELRLKRYRDYAGREGAWDLPTLLYRHLVPSRKGKTLGDDFYRRVKEADTQRVIERLLERVERDR